MTMAGPNGTRMTSEVNSGEPALSQYAVTPATGVPVESRSSTMPGLSV